MKTKRFVFFIAWFSIFALTSLTINQQEKFYYAFDEKTLLIPQENTLLVKFTKEFDRVNMENLLKESITGIKIKWHNPFVAEISTESLRALEDLRLKVKSQENTSSCQPFFKSEDGLIMGVTDEILIRFLPGVSNKQQKELHKKFNTEVIKKTKIYQKLICPKGSDALDIANAYFETGLVEFSTPDFISYGECYQVIPNDNYFGNQVTCHNTGQTFNDGHSGTTDADIDAPEAWEMGTGSDDIVIAVIDQGVTSNHPDLPNNRQVRLNGSDFVGDGDDNPSPEGNGNHGNACAGVIAATMNNNQGIAGIAPGCQIMPIRIIDADGYIRDPEDAADGIEFAVDNGVEILSNSWGYPSSNPNRHPVIVAAIQYALNNNCIVIFAAGNSAEHDDNYDGYVGFPANVEIAGVITVGASDRYDNQANYSPTSDPGSEDNQIIDIVAPSNRSMPWQDIAGETYEMWSIDIPGNTGYNPWPSGNYHPPSTGEQLPNSGTNYLSYTGRFGGTSHSCPVVAGVAALVLSADQSLTYLEVFDILTATADEVGGYTYTNGWSNELGYGRVNACGAVFEAFSGIMSITGSSIVCNSNTTFTLHDRPSSTTVDWTHSSNLTEVSGDGTDNYTVKAHPYASGGGPGWVQATISSDCGDETIQKDIDMVGTPYVNPATIQFTCAEGSGYLCTNAFGNEFSFSYSYDYNYFDYRLTNLSETQTLTQGRIYTTWGTLDYFPPDGTYKFMVRGNNDCGTATNWSKTTVDYVDCFSGGLLSIELFPNPTTIATTVSIVSTNDETAILNIDEKWHLEVYTQSHLLKLKKINIKGNKYILNTSGWKAGVYFVRIYYKDEILYETLIVND